MSGKPNDKWLKTMVKKMGSREAVKEWQQVIGAKGGRKGHTGGFAKKAECNCKLIDVPHTKPQCAGKVGGRIGKRGKSNG